MVVGYLFCFANVNKHSIFVSNISANNVSNQTFAECENVVWNIKKNIINNQFNYFIENVELFYDVKNIPIYYCQNLDVKMSISKNVEGDFWNNKNDIDTNTTFG